MNANIPICVVLLFYFIVMIIQFVAYLKFHTMISWQKQQVFGGELFEHGDLKLSTLPPVTVSYQTWLHMQVCTHIFNA